MRQKTINEKRAASFLAGAGDACFAKACRRLELRYPEVPARRTGAGYCATLRQKFIRICAISPRVAVPPGSSTPLPFPDSRPAFTAQLMPKESSTANPRFIHFLLLNANAIMFRKPRPRLLTSFLNPVFPDYPKYIITLTLMYRKITKMSIFLFPIPQFL